MAKKAAVISYSIENIKATATNKKEFDFFTFEYFVKDIEHLKNSHRHDFYAIIYTSSGTGKHTIDFQEYNIIPNRIFLISYGQVHSWKLIKKLKGVVVLFTKEFYNFIFTGNDKIKSDTILQTHSPYIDIDDTEQNEWESILKVIEQEFLCRPNNYNEIICLLLKVLVLKYYRSSMDSDLIDNKSSRKVDLLNQYKSLINQYYKEWKLPKLYAQLLNITPNYLNGLCNELIEKSATSLIKDRVVLEAKRLLTHSDLTATEIAFELGFEDKSHFGKYFKSESNLTPDTFRQTFKNKYHEI